jgi:predicted nucleic acid-binding protein
MPSVISNSSPLISLSAIQRLDLLRDFFGTVVVPPAVWREVVEEGQGRAGAAEVETASSEGWVRVETFSNDLLLRLSR